MTKSRSLKELMDLSGRVALITGGAGHIGRDVAAALAELGATVAIADRDDEAADEVCAGLSRDYGIKAKAFPIDFELEDEDTVKALPGEVVGALGGLDILVNGAAFVGTSELIGWNVPFEEQSAETWRRALEVNLTSAFVLVQASIGALKRSGRGSVINIASIYGMLGPDMSIYEDSGMGNPAAYGASKGGLIQLTRWLATVLAPDVRVNAITPGGVSRGQPDNFREKYTARTPLRRMAREEDMKGAAAFLAGDAAAYVTGHNLVIDGGWSAW